MRYQAVPILLFSLFPVYEGSRLPHGMRRPGRYREESPSDSPPFLLFGTEYKTTVLFSMVQEMLWISWTVCTCTNPCQKWRNMALFLLEISFGSLVNQLMVSAHPVCISTRAMISWDGMRHAQTTMLQFVKGNRYVITTSYQICQSVCSNHKGYHKHTIS